MLGYELSSVKERFLLAGLGSASLDAELIFSFVLRIGRSKIYAFPERVMSSKEIASVNKLSKRREEHEPMAYILGEKEFWSTVFSVDKNVFIPRPETELLVEISLKSLEEIKSPVIFDIGCGSGAIGISIAKELTNSRVFASDLSEDATICSTDNASRSLLKNYSIIQTFLMTGFLENNFVDLIVSNPPYIPTLEIRNLDAEVSNYGPKLALDGGEDGMFHLSQIIKEAPFYLISQGILLLEIDPSQVESCVDTINISAKYGVPIIHKDFSGFDRVVEVKKN